MSQGLVLSQRTAGVVLSLFLWDMGTAWASSWSETDLRANLYHLRDQEMARGADISEINQRLIEEISHFTPDPRQHRVNGVTYDQALRIIKHIERNPVTGPASDLKYDPSGQIGFCFGRALYAHLDLLRHGVSKDAIKKAFLIGPMRSYGTNWQFHVTTIVKASDHDSWYAVDTFVGYPVKIKDWYEYFKGFSTDKKLRLYITEPQKLGASSYGGYTLSNQGDNLFSPFYNNYFKDLFKFFQDHHVVPEEKFFR